MARNKNIRPNRLKRTVNPDGDYMDQINPNSNRATRHRTYAQAIDNALASSDGDDVNAADAFDPLDLPDDNIEGYNGERYDVPYVDPARYNTLADLIENYHIRMHHFLKGTDPNHRFRGKKAMHAGKRGDPRHRAKGDNRVIPIVRQSVLVIVKPPIDANGKTKLTKSFVLSHMTDERGFTNKLDTRDFSLENLAVPSISLPKMTTREKIIDDHHIKRTESCGLLNFPHGALEPGETPARAAQRHLQFQTGLSLENISCIGVLLPSKQEAREILVPYITYIMAGHARSMNYGFEEGDYPTRTIRPYYCTARDLNALFGVTPFPVIAALANYQHGQFAMEMESFSGPYTSRLHCYRIYSHPLQLHRMPFGRYPSSTTPMPNEPPQPPPLPPEPMLPPEPPQQPPEPELSSGKLPAGPPENPAPAIDKCTEL